MLREMEEARLKESVCCESESQSVREPARK